MASKEMMISEAIQVSLEHVGHAHASPTNVEGVEKPAPNESVDEAAEKHEHGPDCGHTQIEHGGHVGFLCDGGLDCNVIRATMSEKGELHPQTVFVRHALDHSIPKARQPAVVSEHNHSEECGHERIQHGDHFDYLVGDSLHFFQNGLCENHGRVQVRQGKTFDGSRYEPLPTTSPSPVMGEPGVEPRVLRRHDLACEAVADPNADSTNAMWRHSTRMSHREQVRKQNVAKTRARHWWRDQEARRFVGMLFLTGGYMIVELFWGMAVGSLALVADAMHMLSDVIALCVGYYSVRVAIREKSTTATFGWHRMEVVGGLMNGTFLAAMCFSIVFEAIERFMEGPHDELEDGLDQLMIVASIGLAINIIGLFLFGHGGHGHSHGGEGHAHSHGKAKKDGKKKKKRNMAVQGVLLHVLGDALGSVVVLVSAVVMKTSSSEHRFLADPICSLVIVCIIALGIVPLLKRTSAVLLQQVPKNINLDRLKTTLLSVEGVQQIHDLHVWQLNQIKVVGSAHAILYEGTDFMRVSDAMKLVFHQYGVHSTTLQPEFVSRDWIHASPSPYAGVNIAGLDLCHEPLCGSPDCTAASCCPPVSFHGLGHAGGEEEHGHAHAHAHSHSHGANVEAARRRCVELAADVEEKKENK